MEHVDSMVTASVRAVRLYVREYLSQQVAGARRALAAYCETYQAVMGAAMAEGSRSEGDRVAALARARGQLGAVAALKAEMEGLTASIEEAQPEEVEGGGQPGAEEEEEGEEEVVVEEGVLVAAEPPDLERGEEEEGEDGDSEEMWQQPMPLVDEDVEAAATRMATEALAGAAVEEGCAELRQESAAEEEGDEEEEDGGAAGEEGQQEVGEVVPPVEAPANMVEESFASAAEEDSFEVGAEAPLLPSRLHSNAATCSSRGTPPALPRFDLLHASSWHIGLLLPLHAHAPPLCPRSLPRVPSALPPGRTRRAPPPAMPKTSPTAPATRRPSYSQPPRHCRHRPPRALCTWPPSPVILRRRRLRGMQSRPRLYRTARTPLTSVKMQVRPLRLTCLELQLLTNGSQAATQAHCTICKMKG